MVLLLLPQPTGLLAWPENLRGWGMGTIPRSSKWGVGVYIPTIFCKYYYKLTVFSNAVVVCSKKF